MARGWQDHTRDRQALDLSFLWIPATLAAAAAQTARNAMQSRLTATLGTVGATQVRFLFGLPFGLLLLGLVRIGTGEPVPGPNPEFLAFVAAGAVTQIAATALMLAAMRAHSFSIVTAYVKTEPVQTALFGLAVLGDPLSPPLLLAIGIATGGVLLASTKPGQMIAGADLRPALLGLLAGAFFALAAISFRGAIMALPGSALMNASTTLAWGLALQAGLLVAWLLAFDRPALVGSLRAWRGSLTAGFLGALASQFWFIGFALTTAANVRTLALVEVIMAGVVSRKLLSQQVTRREVAGMALIVGGVALLLATQR